jgi:hypothetical protein
MNILNKKCAAMAPTFGTAQLPIAKREKFAWAEPCKPGQFRMVLKVDLNIDGSYQRESVSRSKILDIARDWDWKLFGVLSVIERPDGTLWLYDGGHRCRASFMRDDIESLPCMVFRAHDDKTEARAFVGANTMKSVVSAFHRHRASVKTGEPEAVAVQSILEKHGYSVTQDTAARYGFTAINTLRKMVKEDREMADRVFAACASIAQDGEQVSGQILGGLFACQRKLSGVADILSSAHIEKLKGSTLDGLDAAIRREKHIIGRGGLTVAAKAILDVINKGKHRRIMFP